MVSRTCITEVDRPGGLSYTGVSPASFCRRSSSAFVADIEQLPMTSLAHLGDLLATGAGSISPDPEYAATLLRNALKYDSKELFATLSFAELLHGQGKTGEARRFFQLALKLDPENALAKARLA